MAALETDYSSYEPEYPGNMAVDQSIKDFIKSFFATSDVPGLTDEWMAYYLYGATLVMGKNEAVGMEAIRKLRLGMWEKVEARKHRVIKVFPSPPILVGGDPGGEAVELMMFGDVRYRLKTGDEAAVDWAAYVRLEKRKGQGGDGHLSWGFTYYRVYLQA